MILSNKRIKKAMIRLRGCAGWSLSLCCSQPTEDRFSRVKAHISFEITEPVKVILKNDDEYYHGATTNDPDPATVALRSRPRPHSNTIHHDKFKGFKLVVALSRRFPYHHDSSRIITVLLRLRSVHHDGATVLLRIMLMYLDLTNRGES